jgi:hypothetical protein
MLHPWESGDKDSRSTMRILRLKIAVLLEVEGQPPPTPAPDVSALTPLVLKQYGFLPQPLMITVEGDEVALQFPKETTADEAEAIHRNPNRHAHRLPQVADSRTYHRPAADHGSGSACDSGALG